MPDIRPELSRKNPYWLDKHRYYELKHFCLQYPLWKEIYRSIDGTVPHPYDVLIFQKTNQISDPILRCVTAREEYLDRMHMVEDAAMETSPELADYILRSVTQELTYENLRLIWQIPCGREMWYMIYRKFFYILHSKRE